MLIEEQTFDEHLRSSIIIPRLVLTMSKELAGQSSPTVHHVETLEKAHDIDHLKDIGARYADIADEIDLSPAEQRKYLRRIDLFVMPILFFTFAIQYSDKSILNSAAQFGILKDLQLSQTVIIHGKQAVSLTRFSYATMVYYWGYFLGGTFVFSVYAW
jgi:hypothetical protein